MHSPVTVDDLRRAVTLIDPEINGDMLEGYVNWVMPDGEPVELNRCIDRLYNGTVKRVGRKP
jgi:hypothetical protein